MERAFTCARAFGLLLFACLEIALCSTISYRLPLYQVIAISQVGIVAFVFVYSRLHLVARWMLLGSAVFVWDWCGGGVLGGNGSTSFRFATFLAMTVFYNYLFMAALCTYLGDCWSWWRCTILDLGIGVVGFCITLSYFQNDLEVAILNKFTGAWGSTGDLEFLMRCALGLSALSLSLYCFKYNCRRFVCGASVIALAYIPILHSIYNLTKGREPGSGLFDAFETEFIIGVVFASQFLALNLTMGLLNLNWVRDFNSKS